MSHRPQKVYYHEILKRILFFIQFYVILSVTPIHNLLRVLSCKATFWSVLASPLNASEVSFILIILGINFIGNMHNKMDFYV